MSCHTIRPSELNPGKWLTSKTMLCKHTEEQMIADYMGPQPEIDPHTDVCDTIARLMGALRDQPDLIVKVKELLP